MLPEKIYGQDDNQERLRREVQWGGYVRALVLDEADVLLAEGDSVVRIPLLGDSAFKPVARLTLEKGPILDLVKFPQALYALTPGNVYILSPDGSQVRASIEGGGEALVKYGDVLGIVTRQAGVRLFDVQSDGGLVMRGRFAIGTEQAQAAFVNEHLLTLSDRASGLRLIEVNDDGSSQLRSLLTTVNPVDEIAVFANQVYVSRGHRLYVVDISEVTNPNVVGVYAPLHELRDVVIDGSQVFAADGADGLKVYALESDGLHYLGGQVGTPAMAVAYDSERQILLSAQQDGVRLYDARQLPEFHLLGFMPLWAMPTSLSLIPDTQLGLVTLGTGGLAVIDVSIPQAPLVLAAHLFAGPVQHAVAHPEQPELVYLTLGDGGLFTVRLDLADPRQIDVLSRIPVPGQPMMAAIDSTHSQLGIAAGRAGLQLFAIEDSQEPHYITTIRPESETGIKQVEHLVSGNWAVLDGDMLRRVVVINDKVYSVDALRVEGDVLAARGDGTIFVGKKNRLLVSSVQDQALVATYVYEAPQKIKDITALLGQIILATDLPHLITLDFISQSKPHEQTRIPLPFPAERLLVRGDDLLVINHEMGMAHVRFSLLMTGLDNIEPDFVGNYRPLSDAQALVISEGEVWGAISEDGLFRRDSAGWEYLSADRALLPDEFHQENPAWLDADLAQSAKTTSLSEDGEWLAVASGECGLQIFQAQDVEKEIVFAEWTEVSIGEVYFEDDTTLVALAGGVPSLFHFDPSQDAALPPEPYAPFPPHEVETSEPVQRLSWHLDDVTCRPLRYEIQIDGEVAGVTNQTHWELEQPLQNGIRWQVVVIDDSEQRRAGPEWRVLVSETTWSGESTLLAMQANPARRETEDSLPWEMLVVLLVTIGFGIGSIIWRGVVRRQS